jgi:hypothetical protein
MRVRLTPVLLAAAVSLASAQQPKSQAKPQAKAGAVVTPPATATAEGVFVGRSGKPMAKARLFLGEVTGDEDSLYAKVKLPARLPSAVADEQGRFQFKGFPPGKYTIVYQPAGASGLLPAEFNIKALVAVDKSMAPGLRGMELGKNEPLADRAWGVFTLLKGHTFMADGQFMKIWNATARRNPHGPFVEIRRGLIWMQPLGDKSQLKLEAWSF